MIMTISLTVYITCDDIQPLNLHITHNTRPGCIMININIILS